jgi:predicted nucleotidyltransferase
MPTTLPPPAKVVEGFAVETTDGLIFTVKGVVHPPAAVVAYLRYVPDPGGDRGRAGRRYRRVYRFADQQAELRARGLSYLAHDPMFGVPLQAVPLADVRCVYDPRRRLDELAQAGPADVLEESALALVETLRAAAGVARSALGLTGSLLFGLHNADSDIDIVVYGDVESRAVHRALGDLLDTPGAPVRRPRGEELDAIHAVHRDETPLSPSDFVRLQAAKVNEGRFGGRAYFVRFVKRPEEVRERYGDPRYEPAGRALLKARIRDDADALFTPCRYIVDDVVFVEGEAAAELLEIVSFRGRFADQARRGETVVAQGELETVISRDSNAYARLVVGGRPGDYLLSRPG